jgi:hypothetical protein
MSTERRKLGNAASEGSIEFHNGNPDQSGEEAANHPQTSIELDPDAIPGVAGVAGMALGGLAGGEAGDATQGSMEQKDKVRSTVSR